MHPPHRRLLPNPFLSGAVPDHDASHARLERLTPPATLG
jgi:hypothetical protein